MINIDIVKLNTESKFENMEKSRKLLNVNKNGEDKFCRKLK